MISERNYLRFLIAAMIGMKTPKKMGTNMIIGKSESLDGELVPDPPSCNPINNRMNTTTPINNKNTPVIIWTVLANCFNSKDKKASAVYKTLNQTL